MARIILDEDFPHPVGRALQRWGHDVLTPADVGRAGRRIPDDQVLAFATADARTVLTLNQWDFVRLHRASAAHGGIIVCTTDADYEAVAGRVHDAIRPFASLAGRLVRVCRPSK